MYVPLPPELTKATCGALSIMERLEPCNIPMPDYLCTRAGSRGVQQAPAAPDVPLPGLKHDSGLQASDLIPTDLFQFDDEQLQAPSRNSSPIEETAEFMELYAREGPVHNCTDLHNLQNLAMPVPPRLLNLVRRANNIDQEAVMPAMKPAGKPNRWWTLSHVLCPLSGFPIALLPYPPFKLRMQADKNNPHALVDGRFLALRLISSGSLVVNGRCLQPAEVAALEEYIHRCKLGRLHPEHAMTLAEYAKNPELSRAERQKARQELRQLRTAAKTEFRKLKQIQEKRLTQVCGEGLTCTTTKSKPRKGAKASERQVESGASLCSGSFSFSELESNYNTISTASPISKLTANPKSNASLCDNRRNCGGVGGSPMDALSEVSTSPCEELECLQCSFESSFQSDINCCEKRFNL